MKTLLLFMTVGLIAGAFIGGFLSSQTVFVYSEYPPQENFYATFLEPGEMNGSSATILVPAVDNEGNGVATELLVHVEEGSGRALVNIDKLLFWTDTQTSIRTAREVAQTLTGLDLSGYDIVYTIRADAQLIEGPSAGAALTVATIAALQGWDPDPEVMVTGTISPDGTVGKVGSILEKAQAANSIGASTFLVPEGQSITTVFVSKRTCQNYGFTEICSVQQVPEQVDVGERAGIAVEEVRAIGDALEFFR
jgi:uncharacterized protein